jgi:hypothetical protein
MPKKPAAIITALVASALVLAGCRGADEGAEARAALQRQTTLANSLEKENLREKLERENNPNAVRYVYLISFAQPIGYYVIRGKVSSSGSQLAPEQEAVRMCGYNECWTMTDSAQDDGTYGSGDPGIFFFLADGTMVSTTLDYIESDQPLPLQVPLLGD